VGGSDEAVRRALWADGHHGVGVFSRSLWRVNEVLIRFFSVPTPVFSSTVGRDPDSVVGQNWSDLFLGQTEGAYEDLTLEKFKLVQNVNVGELSCRSRISYSGELTRPRARRSLPLEQIRDSFV